MARSNRAPAEPAADATPLPETQANDDTTEIRVEQQPSLDDAREIAEQTEEPTQGRTPNRHDQAMVDIVARRRERLEFERAEGRAQGMADQEPLTDAEPAAPAAQGEGEPTPEPGAAAPLEPVAAVPPVRTHKILVRGNEIMMSDDDLRRAAELGVESEVRIRHADAVLQEARRVAAASGQPIQGAGPSPPAAAPPTPASEPSDADRDAMRELARELLYGDEEKVVDALQRALAARQTQQPVDPAALADEVYSRVDTRLGRQNALQSALQTFGSEYPEIVNDPALATLAANYVQQLRAHYDQTQTPRAELDLYREAGNATRQDMQRWTGGGQPAAEPAPVPQPSAGQSRITVKRNMPQAPAAGAAQSVTPVPQTKTGSDIVNEMRRARGQPVLV